MSASHKIDDDATSARDLAAREILATARGNVASHVERNERVARELALARANIARLDPKRFASVPALALTRSQDVAARLRQERVARTLRTARDNVARLADIPSRRPAQTVYKTKTDARGPEAPRRPPSPAPVASEDAPHGEASCYEVCCEAIVEFILEKFAHERARARDRRFAARG